MEESYESSKWRNVLIVILLIVFVDLMTFEQGLIPTNVDPIQLHFGIGPEFIGYFVGAYTLTLATMTLFFGYFTDKRKRTHLLILGAVIWSSCAIISFFSGVVFVNFPVFVIARVLAGVGLGCMTPVGFSLLTDVISSGSRSKAFAVWGIATTIGAVAGALIGAELFTAYKRTGRTDLWADPLLFIGVAGMFLVAVVVLFPEPKRAAMEDKLKDILSKQGLAYSYRIKRSDLKNIYKRKSNFWLIVNFIDTIYPGLLILWVFTYLAESFNLAEGVLSAELLIFLGMVLLGLLAGTAIFSWLGDRAVRKGDIGGRAKIAVWCAILTSPFVALAFSVPLSTSNFLWIGLLLAVGMAINSGIAPNWYASIIDVNLPENRGTMIATASFLDNIGRSMGQIIGGIMIASMSIFLAFQWATIFLVLQTFPWIPVMFYIRKDLKEVQDILAERAKEIENSMPE